MQLSAAASTLIANRPIERTALRTKSTSTSEAYLDKRRVIGELSVGYEGRTPEAQLEPPSHSPHEPDGT